MLKIEKAIDDCNQICLKMKNNLKEMNNEIESIRHSIEMRSMESMPNDLDSINNRITTLMELYGELSEL